MAAEMLPFDPTPLLSFCDTWDLNRVQMLDYVVSMLYSAEATPAQRKVADDVLTRIHAHPDSWRVVDSILSNSSNPNAKFVALRTLDGVIATRWLVLEQSSRDSIKAYVVRLVLRISSDEAVAQSQRHVLAKLNETLVQIVKQEWPHAWESFIPELCGAARGSQSMCENTLRILNLLSEEVFSFGKDRMVSKKVAKLRETLEQQLSVVYELCNFVFKSAVANPCGVKPSLMKTALSTLANFLQWCDVGYIFETDLVETLLVHFWDPLEYRIECARCLNEVAGLREDGAQYRPRLVACFRGVVEKIQQLPPEVMQALTVPGRGSILQRDRVYWETLNNQIALLLTTFMRLNMSAMEGNHPHMLPALEFLLRISATPSEESFKICVEFWNLFVGRLFVDHQCRRLHPLQSPLMLGVQPSGCASAAQEGGLQLGAYSSVLSAARKVFISKMAKPPEVTIKENEEGHIVRVEEEDTDDVALYRIMREVLIYLTHLDVSDMEAIMLSRLSKETLLPGQAAQAQQWSPTQLNRLCWAIGSISGSMQETDEKRFVVSVIKDLLSLCEMMQGKENKAVVASNVMYVVGQYPRFLRAHWKFLKSVVFKLFDFMLETFPGIQEMAVETLLKITMKCKKKFVVQQARESQPLVNEMPMCMNNFLHELDHLSVCTFFEALGYMVSAAAPGQKEQLISMLMATFNERWARVLQPLQSNVAMLEDSKVLLEISLILRGNERMASAIGAAYHAQLGSVYTGMLDVYKACSGIIARMAATPGAPGLRLMRNVKRDVLRLVQTFVDKGAVPESAQESGMTVVVLAQRFIPPLLNPVLGDYRSSVPAARDAEVLELLTTLAVKLSDSVSAELSEIFSMVVESTLDMIKLDFQSYPDHRAKLYGLLSALNLHCFQALFLLPEVQLKLYVDSLLWALRHEQPQVADLGLKILLAFLEKIPEAGPHVALGFYTQYYFRLLGDVLTVLTDTLHRSGFKLQQEIMLRLVLVIESGRLETAVPKQKVQSYLFDTIHGSFPTLHRSQVEIFVLSCFNTCGDPGDFLQLIRDFLIQLKEWGSHEGALYEEERLAARQAAELAKREMHLQIPGMVPQYDPSQCINDDEI